MWFLIVTVAFKPKFHLARHVTTQHAIKPMHLTQEKVVPCCRDTLVTTSTTRTIRGAQGRIATARAGVSMSTSLYPEVVPEIDANPEHKELNLYTRVLLILRRPPCWNKARHARHARQARHDALDMLNTSYVSCRDATSGIWSSSRPIT